MGNFFVQLGPQKQPNYSSVLISPPPQRCNICTTHFVQITDFPYHANIAQFLVNQFLHTMLRELSCHHGRHGVFMQEMVMWCGMWLPGVQLFQFFCVFFWYDFLKVLLMPSILMLRGQKWGLSISIQIMMPKWNYLLRANNFFNISTRGT